MKRIELSIPDMQSPHCRARVNNVIKNIDDLKIETLEPGKLTAEIADDDTLDELTDVIEKAGYKVI